MTQPALARQGLLSDNCFWFALLLGLLVSGAYAIVMGSEPGSRWQSLSWQQLAWLVLLYPVIEELVFRGWIQSYLLTVNQFQPRIIGLSLANISTSIVFSIAHVPAQGMLWAMLVFAPSLIFGFFRERYNSVVPAVVLHIAYNGMFFAMVSK